MREHLVVYSQLEGLALLQDVDSIAVQGERVLEGRVGRQFALEHGLSIHY